MEIQNALDAVAARASALKEAEVRVLIALASRAQHHPAHLIRASSRRLTRITGLARWSVQTALDSLTERGLIETDGGTRRRASTWRLLFLPEPVPDGVLGRGLEARPLPQKEIGRSGLGKRPLVAQLLRHPGTPATAPVLSRGDAR